MGDAESNLTVGQCGYFCEACARRDDEIERLRAEVEHSDGWRVFVDRSDGPDKSVAVISRRVGSDVQILGCIEIPAALAGGKHE